MVHNVFLCSENSYPCFHWMGLRDTSDLIFRLFTHYISQTWRLIWIVISFHQPVFNGSSHVTFTLRKCYLKHSYLLRSLFILLAVIQKCRGSRWLFQTLRRANAIKLAAFIQRCSLLCSALWEATATYSRDCLLLGIPIETRSWGACY